MNMKRFVVFCLVCFLVFFAQVGFDQSSKGALTPLQQLITDFEEGTIGLQYQSIYYFEVHVAPLEPFAVIKGCAADVQGLLSDYNVQAPEYSVVTKNTDNVGTYTESRITPTTPDHLQLVVNQDIFPWFDKLDPFGTGEDQSNIMIFNVGSLPECGEQDAVASALYTLRSGLRTSIIALIIGFLAVYVVPFAYSIWRSVLLYARVGRIS